MAADQDRAASRDAAIRRFAVERWHGDTVDHFDDAVGVEEPLEIRIHGVSIAVIMRTPGDDIDLVRGFLLGERVVGRSADIVSIRPCTLRPDGAGSRVTGGPGEFATDYGSDTDTDYDTDNVMQVHLAAGVEVDLVRLRRNLFANSGCGICGKATIEQALGEAPALTCATRVRRAVLDRLPGRLAGSQPGFGATGGLHAAGLFTVAGELVVAREDVGRHNAVDKVLGFAVAADLLPLSDHVLMVSGRLSYEIVQKALVARLPAVAAVSAPTSLAVDLATSAGMVLIGFLREGRMNVYGARDRVLA